MRPLTKRTGILRRPDSRRKLGQISVSRMMTAAGFTASRTRRTLKAQSRGKKITASAKGMRSLARAKPVRVVVETTRGRWGRSL